jgi:uncharacterized membrane protein
MQWWNAVSDGTVPWPMFLPMLWPIVMIGGIVVLVMLLMRSGRTETLSTWRRDGHRQTPFEILSERIARGEIDRREYEERKGLSSKP